MRRGDSCYTCRFWLGHGVRERGPKGTCRRYPPVVTDRAPGGTFPITLSTDWCGEWHRHQGLRADSPGEQDPAPTLYDEL
ncbi:hypothetical protein HHL28_07230 [Aerophototrophica crusticola]|uniref:Uncharacterized protein n=1 Tax=Aerophototrophica crusticola TaxID=1709002 RepID=A0A858R2T4_9PROT|nr:hypothetical protein HHL28_07230 [Rhodospirillaceae bacterium B3]